MVDAPPGAAESDPGRGATSWPRRWYHPLLALAAVAAALTAFFLYSTTVHIRFGIFPQPPLYGLYAPVFTGPALWVVPAGLLLAGMGWLVSSSKRITSWLALTLIVGCGVMTAAAVALVRGDRHALTKGVSTARHVPYYTTDLHFVYEYGVRGFVEHYPSLVPQFWTYNAKTHPPGVLVFLYLVFQTLGHSHALRIATALAVIAMSAAVAVWSMGRHLGGERAGRIAAVLFVAAPGPLLLTYTNLDVIFAVALSASVALLMVAIDRESATLAAVGGTVLGLSTLMTYATAFVALAALVAAVIHLRDARRVLRLVGAAALACAAVLLLAWLTLGFDLLASYHAVARSDTAYDPYWTFAHPVAWLTWAGLPLAALGTAGLLVKVAGARRPVLPLALIGLMLVWGALPAVITGLRYGEVERTWAFLYPVLAAAAGPVVDRWTKGAGRWAGAIVAGLVVVSVAQTMLLQSLWDNLL
jgi:Dolichyl-phosphate-mannose-protein mannosyltransferase